MYMMMADILIPSLQPAQAQSLFISLKGFSVNQHLQIVLLGGYALLAWRKSVCPCSVSGCTKLP
jgi:hypothetical protein